LFTIQVGQIVRLSNSAATVAKKRNRVKKVAKIIGWMLAIGVALALIASILVLYLAQFAAEPNHAIISLGDTEIAVRGLFDQPIWTIIGAWLIVGAAIFFAAIAVIATIGMSSLAVVFALAVTVAGLGAVAVLLASPLIAIAVVIWLIVRQTSRRSNSTPPATPPATA
jgi:uncharacterized membrane protein